MLIKNFNFTDQPLTNNKILLLGNFDGIHKGHKILFDKACEIAKNGNINWGIFTFHPHTYNVIHENSKNTLLASLRQKIQTIKENGGAFVSIARFNKDFANLSAEEFVKKIVESNPHMEYIVVGKDYRFAKNRSGNVDVLIGESLKYNIKVCVVDLLMDNENKSKYSSTNMRLFLTNKEPEKVKEYTGKYFEVLGRVKHGDKRGRTINFPTINILLGKYTDLKFGVYLVEVQFLNEEQIYYGMANVGLRPTFKLNKPLIETNIFNFERDVYDKRVAIRFIRFIRDEKKFNSLDELKQAIEADKITAKNILVSLNQT